MLGLILNLLLIGLAILGILYILSGYKETFLSPGIYPQADERGILNQYSMRKNPELSDYTYSSEWELFPTSPVGSYTQVTNNKRFWELPCNGTSAPATFCGAIYSKKNLKKQQPICMPGLSCSHGNRVNFYCSN